MWYRRKTSRTWHPYSSGDQTPGEDRLRTSDAPSTAAHMRAQRLPVVALKRVRNHLAIGRVALLVDRYADDWSRLAYVLVRGQAELLQPGGEEHAAALALLRQRYAQYRTMALEERAVIA